MKNFILLLTVLMLAQMVAAQKAAIIGAKHLTATGDGISILALENLSSGEVYYFTDNEYNNVSHQFNDVAESVVRITITSPIDKGNVIFFKEDAPNTFTATVTPGSGSVTVIHEATSGAFSLADFGESLFLYTDNDVNPTNGVTEIHSAFFPGSLVTSSSSGGPMPSTENPAIDFPNAIVVHNFPEHDYYTPPYDDGVNRVEYNSSLASRTNVNRVKLENPANYILFGNNQDLATTYFTTFNLVTANPIVTLSTNLSEQNEDSGIDFNFTFSLNTPATTDLVIHFAVSGSATFSSDYAQSGATGMNASAGTVTIANGSSSKTVVLSPTAETILEPDESIQLTITAGTGYDAGSPSTQTVIIINDDTQAVVPDVSITGTRHYTDNEDGISEFSFVALKDLPSGVSYMFSGSPFNKSTLLFSDLSSYPSELKWTAPSGGVSRGDVMVVKKTAPNTFVVTKNGSTSVAGTVSKLSPSKKFYISQHEGVFRAYSDTDDNAFNGIIAIHSQIFTYQVSTGFGGNIPASLDLSTLYPGSVLVDGFPNVPPGRLEYNPDLRSVTVDRANFANPDNWLYGASDQDLSPIPFNNIIISEGSSNPLATVVNASSTLDEASGNSAVFTFSLNSTAAGDIAVNFSVGGSATYLADYTVSGTATFSATSGSIVIPDGASSAQLTITPIDDDILETSENVLLTIISGTGYDGGAPSDAFVTITDDDTDDAEPLVAIIGLNHLDPTELSMVALQNIDPNSTFFFLRGEFNSETLSFPSDVGIYKWISPNTSIPKGTVLSVSGPSSGPLTVNCNGTSGSGCGDFTIITSGHSFDFLDVGTKYYVYQDFDEDPSNGITQIHSVIHTGGVYPTTHTGGNLPPQDNPKLKYSNAVVVDGFPNTAPNRTEFDESKRAIHISTSVIEDISNYLHGQPNAALSTTNFTIPPPPAITSFTPATGPVGTSVTITGSHFNPTAASNIVYFGATRANVTAATATQLTVTVPDGGTYRSITVLNAATGLSGAANSPFIATFGNGNGQVFNSSSFAETAVFATGPGPVSVAIGDLDVDGKPDLTINSGSNTVTVFRNISSSGSISPASFAANVEFTTGTGSGKVAIGDLDGDGKSDMAVTNYNSNKVFVLRNISSSGSITPASFAAKVDLTTGNSPSSVAIGDLDGDGKPDLVIANNFSNTVSVFRNISSSGSITPASFAARVDFTTGTRPLSVAIGDLDGDGKPDLAVTNMSSNTVSVLRNISSSGSITPASFATKVDFTTGNNPYSVAIGDLDGDGKPDLAIANNFSNTVSVFHNTSSPGSISSASFAAMVSFTAGTKPNSVAIGDLDGDGKPDLAVANRSSNTVSVFRNISSSGSISPASFAAKVDFTTGSDPASAAIGDLDGDGKADLTVANNSSNTVSVLHNELDAIPPSIPSGLTATAGSSQNVLTWTANVETDLASYKVFGGTTAHPATLLATVNSPNTSYTHTGIINGTTYYYRILAVDNVGNESDTTADVSARLPAPSITSFTPATGPVGTTITITGSDFNTTTAGNIVYFGATRATVSAANASQLTVIVPSGGTYQPITVLDAATGLIGAAHSPFIATFGNGKGQAFSSSSFAPGTDFTSGTSPFSVAIGDLDGDGKPDMAVVNSGSNTVSVFRNISSSGSISPSSFASKVDIPTGFDPGSVAIGDLDGDGKPDMAVANSSSNSVSVFRNISSSGSITPASFAEKVDFTTGSIPFSVAIGDLDGDGKADITIANLGNNTVSVFRNISSSGSISPSSFAAKVDFATDSAPFSVAIGDLDGDEKPDLAVANMSSNTVSIFRNISSSGSITPASFAAKVDFSTGSSPRSVAIGDVDGDGKPDMAVANYSSNTVSVFRNISSSGSISSASFAAKVDLITGSDPGLVAIGDLDGDGKPDMAVANNGSNTVSVFRNISSTGSITSSSFAAKLDFTTGSGPSSVAIGDLDGDGKADLAVASYNNNKVLVLRNELDVPSLIETLTVAPAVNAQQIAASSNIIVVFDATIADANVGTGTFRVKGEQTGMYTGTFTGGGSNTITFDPANDFKPGEVITVTLTPGLGVATYSWQFTAVSAAVAASFVTIDPVTTAADGATAVYAADMDGDGDLDVLSASDNDNKIAWYENDGSGGFTAHTITTSALGTAAVYAADVNGDGYMDVLSASFGDNTIAWYENDGLGGFTAHTITTSASGARSVYAADLDGDGDMDVLSASINDDTIAWYENDGSGGFTAHTISTAADGAYSVYAADVDGDGDMDVLSASINDDTIAWYENDGSGSYTAHTITTSALGATSVYAADMDGDGDMDVLSASQNDDTIAWYENDGSGGFTAHTITTSALGARSVYAADVDGDGDLDVLSASQTDGEITWYENDGSEGFTAHTISTSADRPLSVYAADMDGDGDLDVLSASYNDDKIAWYENVRDLIPPVAVCQNTTVELDMDGQATIVVADVDGGSTDNIEIATLAIDIDHFTCAHMGENTVTLTVTDTNGNSSMCSATVTVEDKLSPEFQDILPEDQIGFAEENGEYILEDFTIGLSAIDNCNNPLLPVVISQDPAVGTVLTTGIHAITLGALDAYGNLTQYAFELTVEMPITTGVVDIDMKNAIGLYPNPAETVIHISNPQRLALEKLSIYNMSGRLVSTFNLSGIDTEKIIDVSDLPNAAYLIVIQGEKESITKQLLKK
jgi:hypothetical protein